MKVRRSKALRAPRPKPLFEVQVPDVVVKVRACQASGVELSQFERKYISDFPSLRKRSPQAWRIFWKIAAKCGVSQ
ncbi:unnamed protein product [uncultured bacterium]|nr:unnamed protein product [uncultured bacterium]